MVQYPVGIPRQFGAGRHMVLPAAQQLSADLASIGHANDSPGQCRTGMEQTCHQFLTKGHVAFLEKLPSFPCPDVMGFQLMARCVGCSWRRPDTRTSLISVIQ